MTAITGNSSSFQPALIQPNNETGSTQTMAVATVATQTFKSWGKLPVVMQEGILFFAIDKISIETKTNKLIGFNAEGFCKENIALEQAHSNLEHITGMIAFVTTSKMCHKHLQPKINRLRQEIVTLFTDIHNARGGPRRVREMIDYGKYLSAFKIYIQAKPEAIFNAATTENHDGLQRTLLHNAVAPRSQTTLSISFVNFLFETIKKNGMLAIFSHRDRHNHTPFNSIQSSLRYYNCPVFETREETIEYLEGQAKANDVSGLSALYLKIYKDCLHIEDFFQKEAQALTAVSLAPISAPAIVIPATVAAPVPPVPLL